MGQMEMLKVYFGIIPKKLGHEEEYMVKRNHTP
jgi:hypothetical protein